MSAMLEVEKAQMENKKRASMRDLQALIVREKDAEIARLTMEVVRLTEIQEQVNENNTIIYNEYVIYIYLNNIIENTFLLVLLFLFSLFSARY